MTTVANVAVTGEPFLPREQVRPEHVADARGKQRERGESDDRRAETPFETAFAERASR